MYWSTTCRSVTGPFRDLYISTSSTVGTYLESETSVMAAQRLNYSRPCSRARASNDGGKRNSLQANRQTRHVQTGATGKRCVCVHEHSSREAVMNPNTDAPSTTSVFLLILLACGLNFSVNVSRDRDESGHFSK